MMHVSANGPSTLFKVEAETALPSSAKVVLLKTHLLNIAQNLKCAETGGVLKGPVQYENVNFPAVMKNAFIHSIVFQTT